MFKKLKNKKVLALIVLVLLVVGANYGAWHYYSRLQDSQKEVQRLSDPTVAAKEETARLLEKITQLVDVPTDETPTVATVSDASKLKSQSFFARAENGDKVLIYTQAKRAILYRPSTDKIIEIAPVNIGESTETNSSKPTR